MIIGTILICLPSVGALIGFSVKRANPFRLFSGLHTGFRVLCFLLEKWVSSHAHVCVCVLWVIVIIIDKRVIILSDMGSKKKWSNNNDVDVQRSPVSRVSHILCYNIVGRYLNKILTTALKTFIQLAVHVQWDYSLGVLWRIRTFDPFYYSSVRLHVIRQRGNAVIDHGSCVLRICPRARGFYE